MNKIASKIENWLTGMQMVQMFSFGGQSPPSLPSPAPSNYELGPGPRRKLCPEIPVIPMTTFGQFVAFEIPEIFRKPRIEK